MTKRAIMRRDLHREAANKLILDHQMMPRLLLDLNHRFAGITILILGSVHSAILKSSLLATREQGTDAEIPWSPLRWLRQWC